MKFLRILLALALVANVSARTIENKFHHCEVENCEKCTLSPRICEECKDGLFATPAGRCSPNFEDTAVYRGTGSKGDSKQSQNRFLEVEDVADAPNELEEMLLMEFDLFDIIFDSNQEFSGEFRGMFNEKLANDDYFEVYSQDKSSEEFEERLKKDYENWGFGKEDNKKIRYLGSWKDL